MSHSCISNTAIMSTCITCIYTTITQSNCSQINRLSRTNYFLTCDVIKHRLTVSTSCIPNLHISLVTNSLSFFTDFVTLCSEDKS